MPLRRGKHVKNESEPWEGATDPLPDTVKEFEKAEASGNLDKFIRDRFAALVRDEVAALLKNYSSPGDMMAHLIDRTCRNGELVIVWENLVAKAKDGDPKSIKEVLERIFGKAPQSVAIMGAGTTERLDDQDRDDVMALVESLRGASSAFAGMMGETGGFEG